MREKRRERRSRTKEWAKIVIEDGKTVYNCTIVDISSHGASLRVGIAALPDRFLLFRKTDRTLREATVRSRRYQTVGVELALPLNLHDERAKAILDTIAARTPEATPPSRRARRGLDGWQDSRPVPDASDEIV